MEEINWKGRMLNIIKSKEHPIGIVGLGYVGLPLAVAFANKGYKVVGVDVNKKRVSEVNAGMSPITDVKNASLQRLVKKGLIKATDNHAELQKTFVIIICVPTPLNKNKQPDLSYVEDTASAVGRCMYKGSLVVLESTSYPGTTRDVVYPIIERSGKDKKFFLAYSPERVDPSSRLFTLRNTPKLVAGMDDDSTEVAVELYSAIVKKVVRVSRPEIGETAKVFENVFRSVNIGLVNELAMMCEKLGISVWEVLEAAETKPFGFMRFSPSPGVGGHCIPIDPYYLDQKATEVGFHSRFIRVAMDINEQMPNHVVEGIARALDLRQGKALSVSTILVLGVAYKQNVADTRESPSLEVLKKLYERGATVRYYDSFVPYLPEMKMTSVNRRDLLENIKEVDCVVMATNHSEFTPIWRHIVDKAKLVYDARGWTYTLKDYKLVNPQSLQNVVRLGE